MNFLIFIYSSKSPYLNLVITGNADDVQLFKIQKMYLHPMFESGKLNHDIALVLLDKEVQ